MNNVCPGEIISHTTRMSLSEKVYIVNLQTLLNNKQAIYM